ncbi:MAG: type I glyceraldehyde-3-phosphate dehydrogenase [Eubacteriales bacterium]|nr:type I glyceraldehyde-3-phosphate dehydrogenase [Eubacteriales bacterium]
MTVKVGISGFGRIGKVILRAAQNMPDVEIVGINKRNADIDYMLYMLKYDTVFGRFPKECGRYEDGLIIDGRKIPVYGENDITKIPWKECGAEYVIEATGAYLTTEKAMGHIQAGAKKVIISAPAKDDVTPTFVYKVNSDSYTSDMQVVSNASCTTNCLAPMCKVLNDTFGIEEGLMTTIHAATAKQFTVDSKNPKDWRRGRSVFGNIIPTTTGAAKAIGKVIPELNGKLNGIAVRIPAADSSLTDLTVRLKKSASMDEIRKVMKEASEGSMKGVIEYVDDPVVSTDFIGDANTSIFDATAGVQLTDHFFKLIGFYDNEFGYSSKTLELARHMYAVDHK